MNTPPRLFLALLGAAILGISTPQAVSADPVTISSGSISIPPLGLSSSPIQLVGTDGVVPFLFTGSISPDSNIALKTCKPCNLTATMISLAIVSVGSDLPGLLTYGNDRYVVGGLLDTFGSALISISGFAALPPPPSMTNQLATVMGPFTMLGGFVPPLLGGPFSPRNTLRGGGIATATLRADASFGDGVRWTFLSAAYQFEPIPEPASFVLFGSGLVGLAMRRQKRRRREL